MTRRERLLLILVAASSLLLRAVAYFRYRFDADEQQHLHVSWGWTDGMVQYRDFFDNHTPLFHIVTAPLVALIGERSDILLWMRAPMLLLFAVVLYGTYVVAAAMYDRRVAIWSVVLLSIFPPFFLKSLEFRTDNLWNAVWMLTLVALVRGRSSLLIGFLLGIAFAVSMKTSLLVITLVVATALAPRLRARFTLAETLRVVAGFAIVPGILAIYFAAVGAWDALVYCTITFNGNLSQTRPSLWIARAAFPFMLAAVIWISRRFRPRDDDLAAHWRHFFATALGVFTITLAGFWLLISPRDFLPVMPLVAISIAALAPRLRVTTFHAGPQREFVYGTIALISAGSLWYYADRFENNTDWHITMMDQLLRISRPGEMVMDIKGETIFRRRPFYYAFEYISRTQIEHGILEDTVAEDVIRTRTYVAQADGPLWPGKAKAFLAANFIDMGRLRAAGQWVQPDGSFSIAIPGEYVVVTERGEATGLLDGTPYRGARHLAEGPHRFEGSERAAVMWAPAFERGHSPFHLRDLDF